jgi:hypothetical protein
VLRFVARIALVPLLVLLSACNVGSGNTSSPGIPQNMVVTAGDGQVVITWDFDPSLQYWVFLAEGGAISLNNYFNNQGARVVTPAYSPQIIDGLGNGVQYAFIMNATRNGGGAGPTTNSQSATPQAAGVNWTLSTTPAITANLEAVTFGGGLFVAVGQGGVIYTGTYTGLGAISWTQVTSNFPAGAGDLHGVTWNGVWFVAVGDGGNAVYSDDGYNWTAVATGTTSGTTANLRSVAPYGGYFVAVGDGGTIVYTTTLTGWAAVTPAPTANNLVNVANLAGYLTVLGDNGTLLLSLNVLTWAPPAGMPSLPGITLRSSADAANVTVNLPTPVLVVVGDQGTVLTSPDAVNFTLGGKPNGSSVNLRSVFYGSGFGSRLVAVGDAGNVFYSDNATTWALPTIPPATTQNLNGVAFGKGAYVVVGDAGTNAISQ